MSLNFDEVTCDVMFKISGSLEIKIKDNFHIPMIYRNVY